MHFEELWEKCEKIHQDDGNQNTPASIIDEISMKINLYKLLDGKTDISKEDLQIIKSRTMGEILLTLTKLSLADNINVFEALNIARQYRSMESSLQIPADLRLPK